MSSTHFPQITVFGNDPERIDSTISVLTQRSSAANRGRPTKPLGDLAARLTDDRPVVRGVDLNCIVGPAPK